MSRRNFIGLIGVAVTSPSIVRAQLAERMPLVGFLWGGSAQSTAGKERLAAVRKGLQELNLVEGTNYRLTAKFAEGNLNHMPQLVLELGALNPRVIVTAGYVSRSFSQLVSEVPMVFTGIAVDPVEIGVAQSYAHPGGMITGNVMNAVGGEETVAQKRIGYFKSLVPNLKRLGVIAPVLKLPEKEETRRQIASGWLAMKEKEALQKVAAQLAFEVSHYDLNTIEDLEVAFASGVRENVSAFYISTEPLLFANLPRVIRAVQSARTPSLGTIPEWGRAGLLMSYATDVIDGVRRAGLYAGRILHGAKPGDLPIEQASKFTLVVNKTVAQSLGIQVPATVLALADEVIE